MILTKKRLRDELLKKDNNYLTDIQLVFSTHMELVDKEGFPWSDKRKVEYLTDKLEETVHRVNLKLCRYFMKRPETRIHFAGFIEGLKGKNLHCHSILKIPTMYDVDDVIGKLKYHFESLHPSFECYRGSYRPELYFQNTEYSMKEYRPDNDLLTFIYL